MLSLKTPVLYSFCLLVFVFLTIQELTRVKTQTRFDSWNKCVLNALNSGGHPREFWNKSSTFLSECEPILNDLKPTKLASSTKLHVFSSKNSTEQRVHVSFGRFENDTQAEIQLRKLAPNTVFYSTETGGNEQNTSRRIGTVLDLEVGQEAGLVVEEQNTTEYRSRIKVGMAYFLREILKRDLFDSIWFNSMPSDFSISNAVLKEGEFDRNGIIVCQINFEVDGSEENGQEFHEFFVSLISDRQYVMFMESSETSRSVFLVNWSSSRCRERMGLKRDE